MQPRSFDAGRLLKLLQMVQGREPVLLRGPEGSASNASTVWPKC